MDVKVSKTSYDDTFFIATKINNNELYIEWIITDIYEISSNEWMNLFNAMKNPINKKKDKYRKRWK